MANKHTQIQLDGISYYDTNSYETVATEAVTHNFYGDSASSNAKSFYSSIKIGGDATFKYISENALNIVYSTKSITIKNERVASVKYTAKGYLYGAGAKAIITKSQVNGCVNDYKIHKIPKGNTILIDYGKHYKTIKIRATGVDFGAVDSLLRGLNPSGGTLMEIIVETINKLDGSVKKAIGQATYIVGCSN